MKKIQGAPRCRRPLLAGLALSALTRPNPVAPSAHRVTGSVARARSPQRGRNPEKPNRPPLVDGVGLPGRLRIPGPGKPASDDPSTSPAPLFGGAFFARATVTLASANKCLADKRKSRTGVAATKGPPRASRQGGRLMAYCSLVFWERGAQNRGKQRHLIDARRQLSDKLFQAVVQ